ncbi:MAG: extracellular solute-binding protein [Clostridiales bacterium]|nr:extracellular solute-binding protein [Clostridiales bacterium]
MKKKKIAALTMCMTMAASMMIGCGSDSQSASTGNEAEETKTAETSGEEGTVTENPAKENKVASGETVKLTIAARGGSHVDVINAVKEKFEQENNVEIEVLGLEAADLKQKVALDAMNEEGTYDIVMIDDPVMPEFTENNVLLNLTAEGYEDDSDFLTASLALGKNPYGTGDTYALPFSGNVQLLFYNKDVLVELGKEVPESWAEVLEISQAAKDSGKNGYIIRGQQGNPIVSDYLPLLWAYGGDVFDENWNVTVDSTEAKEAMQMYLDLLETGANYEKNDMVSSISGGSSTMGLGWPSWFITDGSAAADYAVIPAKAETESESYASGEIGNWMMGIPANCQHKEIAIELLKYLTSEEVQRTAVDVGAVPTRNSVFADAEILAKYPYLETLQAGTENSVVRPRTAKWSAIEEAYGAELSNIVAGTKNIEQGLADAKTAIEGIMSQN